MRSLLIALTLTLGLSTMVGAQNYYWIAGIDKSIPVYTELNKEGTPGPFIAQLGYDRDTGRMSILYLNDSCYNTWWVRPSAGHGDIVDFFQYEPRVYVLVHADGFIRLETRPDFAYCIPVEQPSVPLLPHE